MQFLFLPLFLPLFCQVGGPLLSFFDCLSMAPELGACSTWSAFFILTACQFSWQLKQNTDGEREKRRFEADAKAWQSVSALCDGCGHPLSNTPNIPSFFPPASLTRTGFIICDEVSVVWEGSALDVYYIRSACTNGETPADHVIITGQKPILSSITSSSSCPFCSFLFSFQKVKKAHTYTHTHSH